jgi:hypothetical protein
MLVQRAMRAHPAAGARLAPSLGKWLPAIATFWGRRESVMLPPPVCLPPAASRNGTPEQLLRASRLLRYVMRNGVSAWFVTRSELS